MTNRNRPGLLARTEWSAEQLDADRLHSIVQFRRERLQEPLAAYLAAFEDARIAMEQLLEDTANLALLEQQAVALVTNPKLRDSFRYLAGPPISLDDLKILVDTQSLAPAALRRDPDLVRRLVMTITDGLDRRRFPWFFERRLPSQSEVGAAVLASAALIATQRVATNRRNEGKRVQEDQVRQALAAHGLVAVDIAGRHIATVLQAPQPGTFCPDEVTLGSRKADLVVRLWDGRIMPIECKVSNSSINSVKRLNNDAAAKAETWLRDFGTTQVVPVAVLSGVYKLHNLEEAQRRGLTLYWAHRLDDLVEWIERTRLG